MPGILPSTPADHSRYDVHWPWSIWAKHPLPDEMFSPDACKEKTPLVKKIAEIYEAPLGDDDHNELQFTGCQNAAFYSLTPAALRSIAPFPKHVKDIGEAALLLGTSCVNKVAAWANHPTFAVFPGNNAHASRSLRKSVKKNPMPRRIRLSVNQRDLKTCLVMGTLGIDHTRIVPLLISDLSIKRFEIMFEFGKLFFAKNFRTFLKSRIQSLRDSGERRYNILSLSPDIRRLFDKALVGFKPLYVGATRSGHSGTYYASFSFHVLGRNDISSYERVMPSDATLYRMQLPCEEQKLTKDEISALDKCILHDGKVIRVPCDGRHQAESMLALLAFRWTISSYWFLAGSPGSQRGRNMGSYENWGQYDNLEQDEDVFQDNDSWSMLSVINAIEELGGELEQPGTGNGS